MTSDQESAATALRRKRNTKCLLYIVAGTILQTASTLVFVLIFMRTRNPKVRFASVAVENLSVNSSSSSPSFTMKLNAQVTVKNTNFGQFKFENSTATISYGSRRVGDFVIARARAGARSTKKMNVTVTVNSSAEASSTDSNMRSDISSGKLRLAGHATVSGKIHLFMVIKKKKTVKMNCTMDVNTKNKTIDNLYCK